MKKFRFLNSVTGWVTFVIAAVTYLLCIEPTASFWDCGEYITTAFKLEVGHPPGNPFFTLIGRLFTLFAKDPSHAGVMINMWSALASAFTILFLFWTITHLARKIYKKKDDELSLGEIIAILGSGIVGALAYTFSDSFWFSAVEAEVYGTSSMITALVFWSILKWENVAGEPRANRWIVLIAYLIGLSIGVHLLNLLAIPAIVFVYYFKQYKTSRRGVIISLVISIVLLALIMYGIIPGLIKVASWFELLFVNVFGLPFNTGLVFYALLLIALIIYGIYYTIKKKKVLWNTALVCLIMIIIGYSSFAMIVIRSSANPPMDQNNPDNVFSLLSYLNRDQYGSRPLVFGQNYNTPLDQNEPYIDSKPYYIQKDGKYVVADMETTPNYDSRYTTFFPRMWSSQPAHVKAYKSWAHVTGHKVTIPDSHGGTKTVTMPTFGDNLTFFIRYQVVHMYLRYFLWNFVGRQNDLQGQGGILRGNWISGINFIDSARLGDQTKLPAAFKNKGHNTYYFLPLLLGLLGAFFHYKRNQKDFWVVMLLFIMTGIAIVIYLNQYPLQPRERDYSYVGSFYAFAIWIGIGVIGLVELARKIKLGGKTVPLTVSSVAVSLISLLAVPCVMASQNWDDHDRSNRYTCRDFGADYLNTCEKNAVIFTNGDNDTFPLWYNQEVQGVRTDMRVCNLSYLQTDWYIDQMKTKAYSSEPLPIDFTHDQYVQGKRDIVYLVPDPRIKGAISLKDALNFIKSDDPRTKLKQAGNAAYIPTKKLFMKVDKKAVIANKVVPKSLYSQIQDTIFFDFSKKSYLTKDELMVLDMIANDSDWKRPLYWAFTVGRDKYMGLEDYFQMEGFAYRFTPVKNAGDEIAAGHVYTKKMYNNYMNNFKWGNMNNPNVYIDENNQRMMMNIRNNFARLAKAIIEQSASEKPTVPKGDSLKISRNDSAIQVLDRCSELVPSSVVPYDYFSQRMAEEYFEAGAPDKGLALAKDIFKTYQKDMDFYLSLDSKFLPGVDDEMQRTLFYMRDLAMVTEKYGEKDLSNQISKAFKGYLTHYGAMGN